MANIPAELKQELEAFVRLKYNIESMPETSWIPFLPSEVLHASLLKVTSIRANDKTCLPGDEQRKKDLKVAFDTLIETLIEYEYNRTTGT